MTEVEPAVFHEGVIVPSLRPPVPVRRERRPRERLPRAVREADPAVSIGALSPPLPVRADEVLAE